MTAPVPAPARPVAARTTSGLLGLILLLLGAIAAAAVLTGYLLRTSVAPAIVVARPAPYGVWYRRGDTLLLAGPRGVAARRPLPVSSVGAVRSVSVAADSQRFLLIAGRPGAERPWLLIPPAAPLALPLPPAGNHPTTWQVAGISWIGAHSLAVLLVGGGSGRSGTVLARYAVAGTPVTVRATWQGLQTSGAQVASLAPAADQVALIQTRAGSAVFAPQVAVRLQHFGDQRHSVALRYLSAAPPDAVLWSPDGGTLAFSVPGQGLAIQKSSGRPVREVPDGSIPAAFSERGADLAYVSGSGTTRQIHVLNLHGEADHQFPAPAGGRPRWLQWTPDAQALLCLVGNTLWQIEPGAGTATEIQGVLPGDPLAVVAMASLT